MKGDVQSATVNKKTPTRVDHFAQTSIDVRMKGMESVAFERKMLSLAHMFLSPVTNG